MFSTTRAMRVRSLSCRCNDVWAEVSSSPICRWNVESASVARMRVRACCASMAAANTLGPVIQRADAAAAEIAGSSTPDGRLSIARRAASITGHWVDICATTRWAARMESGSVNCRLSAV
jgi:hypothetical protein